MVLIPQLQPGNIVIIDNATFHQGQNIRELSTLMI